jgi:hypothetical protein
MKELADYTYQELIDKFTQEIHSALLLKGGEGMRSQVAQTIDVSIRWFQETHKEAQ